MDLTGQIDTLATSHQTTLAAWGLGQIWTSQRRKKSPAPARSQTADLAHSVVTISTMLPGCSMHYKQNISENRLFTDKHGSLSNEESMILSYCRCKSSRMWCLSLMFWGTLHPQWQRFEKPHHSNILLEFTKYICWKVSGHTLAGIT